MTRVHVVFFFVVGMYPLRSINKRLMEIIEACYSDNGVINGKPSVYLPYSSKPEDCHNHEQVRNARLHVTDKQKLQKREKYWPRGSNSALNVKLLWLIFCPRSGRKTGRSRTSVEPSSCRPRWPVRRRLP